MVKEPASLAQPGGRLLLFFVVIGAVILGVIGAILLLWKVLIAMDRQRPSAIDGAIPAVQAVDPAEAFARRLDDASTSEQLFAIGEDFFGWQRTKEFNPALASPGEVRAWLREDWKFRDWGDAPSEDVLQGLGYR